MKESLPDLLAGSDLITRPGNRTVAVPVKFLEHARFRLAEAQTQQGAGQGKGQPGDVLQPARDQGDQQGRAGGTGNGEIRFVVELKIDEIVDWLWEELKLPELKPSAPRRWMNQTTSAKAGTSAARARDSIGAAR